MLYISSAITLSNKWFNIISLDTLFNILSYKHNNGVIGASEQNFYSGYMVPYK